MDAAFLALNPQVVTPEGEWEAWYFGNALPGARRYRNFEEMMVDLRRRTLENVRGGLAFAE